MLKGEGVKNMYISLNDGRKFKCKDVGKKLYCERVNVRNSDSNLVCRFTRPSFVRAGKFVGNLLTTAISIKNPTIMHFTTIADKLIDKSANILHRFNLKNC